MQLVALAVERALDALVDGPFALAQALVLVALHLVVAERRLQLGAQLADLGHQRCHGVARGVALDAERFGFIGCEAAGLVRCAGRVIAR
ncbi:hypothetical protein D3C85_1537800 [compost metagenome]